jgi:hypothetical protein
MPFEKTPSWSYIEKICELYGDIYDDRIEDCHPPAAGNELRKAGENLPIIIMGDNVKQEEIIRLYNAGCDAYVEKPLSVEILICKINAIIRRCDEKQNNKEKVFDFDGKIFDGERHSFDGRVQRGDEGHLHNIRQRGDTRRGADGLQVTGGHHRCDRGIR